MTDPKKYIKFTGKKCIMRPIEDGQGPTETWEVTESTGMSKKFFTYEEQKYTLTSSTEKKNKK